MGCLRDEGEAWKYRYSHMDGTGGKYDLLFRREPEALRRERELVEPQRCAECDCENGGPDCNWIKWDPQPDALALVAAAYRDAAELPAFDCTGDPCGTFDGKVFVKLDAILARTPADAQAALAAIERAAYERGVRDAASEAEDERLDSIGCNPANVAARIVVRILALLTQEGR